jgi:hypothetical protein
MIYTYRTKKSNNYLIIIKQLIIYKVDISRMAKIKWNKETMQQYCNNNFISDIVEDTKWVQKSYQRQLWVLTQCLILKYE